MQRSPNVVLSYANMTDGRANHGRRPGKGRARGVLVDRFRELNEEFLRRARIAWGGDK